ncbi:hypothetical protein Tel_12155 [Candidatus Tenderia electrophaga]|jgi:hypothetical protein|uniref:Uncharacterized protein n=1 Tax=Candidatus Tenderia electrophaga TaxID=1748243 RepID=A0A0S2TFD1_9GAMM|nr:hypothetical protein Tel_12155 [Candidatus Tenderia electrophaga]
MCEWEDRVSNVAHEIEHYLESHPQAADSLEGIASWWIARQRIRTELEVVRAALEQLSHSGIVSARQDTGKRGPIYRLNNKNH